MESKATSTASTEDDVEYVVKVDSDDNEQGVVERLEAHTGKGIRHRAFTSLVFDTEGNILLAQRSPQKRLWDEHWDGTVASHPRENETQEEAVRKRLTEELGITPDQYTDLELTDRFEYRRYYLNEGIEHEVCAVFKLVLEDRSLEPDLDEVAGLMWVPYERLYRNPKWYRQLDFCPWFKIAMRRDYEE